MRMNCNFDLSVRKSLNFLVSLLLLMTAFSSFGAELPIQYSLIARSEVTPIPSGVGRFTGFSEAPAIDSDGNVVFSGAGGLDSGGNYQSGIYTFIGGQHQMVADKNTLVPGGAGATFNTFYGADMNDIDSGRIAFRADISSSGTLIGVYSNAGQANPNDLVELALVDGSEWSNSSHPWVDGNKVAMRCNLPDGQTEMLLWDGSNDYMNFFDPGAGYNMAANTQASISGDAMIFRRYKTGSSEMVITKAGSYEVLAVLNATPVPGQDGLNFTNFNYFPVIDRGGQDAAFRGNGSGVQGVYKRRSGGALEVVADNATVVPGTVNNVFWFFDEAGISVANGQVAFWGFGQNFLNGIYTDIGGALSVIVDNQDYNTIELDGVMEQISDIRVSPKSFAYTPGGYVVVFRATLQSGGVAIISATIDTSPGTGSNFTVFKNFSDNNPGSVSITLSCSSGTVTKIARAACVETAARWGYVADEAGA
jgi:hypothetical protein